MAHLNLIVCVPHQNKNKTKLWLGVTSVGLNIYDERDKLTPKTTFQWNEIRHVSFDDKKFTIRLVDAKVSNFIFYSQDLHINKMVRRAVVTTEICICIFTMFMFPYSYYTCIVCFADS